MDQIQNALKILTDRMSQKSGSKLSEKVGGTALSEDTANTKRTKTNSTNIVFKVKRAVINSSSPPQTHAEHDMERKKDSKESQRNVVIFTGRALTEILRDQTMQKSFMTLAYISDLMVGSEIKPL